ncbi:MAG: hypothetical protein AAFY03_05235 [Pseudomonadota bacterium]
MNARPQTLAIAFCAGFAAPASALSYDCAFDVICVEQLSCQPSDLVVTVRPAAGDGIILATGGRDLPARIIVDPSREARSFVTDLEFNTIHLLSIFRYGIARFTLHTPVQNLQSMTHHGLCEVAQ